MVLVLQLFIALKSRVEIIEANLRISYQKKEITEKRQFVELKNSFQS
jgi:hypothetical protein